MPDEDSFMIQACKESSSEADQEMAFYDFKMCHQSY
jgi:hypothetical protein